MEGKGRASTKECIIMEGGREGIKKLGEHQRKSTSKGGGGGQQLVKS